MITATPFYPLDKQHSVAFMDLSSDAISPQIHALLPGIYELAAVGDALRALQTLDGRYINDQAAKALLQHSADLLIEIAGSLSGPVARVLQMRAASLLGEGQAEAASAQVQAPDDPLVLLCGPLSTWRGKTKSYLHGVAASVPLKDLNALIARADSFLASNARYLQARLGLPALEIDQVPPFVVMDLLACGGEANTYPKQFSYFLPEDEGVKRAKQKKTIVYANLYHTRFHRVSLPLAQETLVPSQQVDLAAHLTMRDLLLWFRGHDIGHFSHMPQTDYRLLRPVGLENSVMLQEAIADVLGYLLVANGPWQQAFQINLVECSTIFLAELLRYMRRGPARFPDSGAAFIELSYLVSHGYVSLVANGGKLAWDPHQLHEGMMALAGELVHVVLRADPERAAVLLAEHSFHPDHMLSNLLTRLTRDFRHLPTAFAYTLSSERVE